MLVLVLVALKFVKFISFSGISMSSLTITTTDIHYFKVLTNG